MKKLDGLKIAHQIAAERGGKCLSTEYIDTRKKMHWRCKEGHEWFAILHSLKNQGSWCPYCAGKMKLDGLKIAKQIAKKQDGRCLSAKYISNHEKMHWECKEEHRWFATLNNVKNNKTWCQRCAIKITAEKNKIDGLKIAQQIAMERGGKCLSTIFINTKTKMRWRCANNHEWEANLNNVTNKTWCRVCAYIFNGQNLKIDGLAAAHQVAKERNGKCLSTEYIDVRTKMHWECEKGHKWFAILTNVKNNNTWCCICASLANSKKRTLDGLKIANQIAKSKGGKCLSTKYINNSTKMQWKCKKNHKWSATLNNVKNNNSWCKECGYLQAAIKQNNSYILIHWKTEEELVCQASYEKRVVKYLNKNKINFRWQSKTFKMPDGRTYRPDMYLYSTKNWIEIKGYFRDKAREKWNWFQTIKPNSELWDTAKLKSMGII